MTVFNKDLFRAGASPSITLIAVLLVAAASPALAAEAKTFPAAEAGAGGSVWALGQGQLHQISAGGTQSFALPDGQEAARSLAVAVDNTLYLAGDAQGVYRSVDGGETWQESGEGLPDGTVNALAAHSSLENIVYANSSGKGIYISKDRGDSWTRIDGGPQEPINTFLHSNLPGSMETGWLFAGTERGVARSMDCFCFWGDAGDLRGEVTALAYDAGAPVNVYAVIENRVHHSGDGGETWSRLAEAPAVIHDLTASGGQLILATDGGLFAWQSEQWETAFD